MSIKTQTMTKTTKTPAIEAVDRDLLVRILRSYRLQYTQDEFGDVLRLEDVLTPPDQSTVRLGIMEIRLLADYILGEINSANDKGDSQPRQKL